MAASAPYAVANAKKRAKAAKEMRAALKMNDELNYPEICAQFEVVLRNEHIPALKKDILRFADKFKEKGPLEGQERCVQTALAPLKRDMRFLQAELQQPRMMLPLIEDEEKRRKMREIYEKMFIFHALIMEPMPEMSPLRVTDEEFNQCLIDRAALITREEYEALIPKVPGFDSLNALSLTVQELIKATLDEVNATLASRQNPCSHCQKNHALRCTGCKQNRFCSRLCQRNGQHDAECPVSIKRAQEASTKAATD
jgi:hypothetical protein